MLQGRVEGPNPKNQVPSKLQSPKSKRQRAACFENWILEFGACLDVGAWDLGFAAGCISHHARV